MSAPGFEFLKQQEGVKREVYRDSVGLPTIGVGHLLTRDELSSGKLAIDGEWVRWHDGLTDAQVMALCNQDTMAVEYALNADGLALTQHQFDALVSWTFNVGTAAYAGSTLRKKLLLGLLADVPAQLERWVYAGGMVSAGLKKRRDAEVQYWNRPDVAGTTGG